MKELLENGGTGFGSILSERLTVSTLLAMIPERFNVITKQDTEIGDLNLEENFAS